jgi:hypothetical protein
VLKQPNLQAETKQGITIGWQLVKNPRMQSMGDLQKHLNQLNPTYSKITELKEAFNYLDKGSKSKEQELER